MHEIKTIMVAGSGLMGSGIAQVAAQAGYQVNLYNKNKESVIKGYRRIIENLNDQVRKEKLTEAETKEILARIGQFTDIKKAGEADFIIEAVPEDAETKKKLIQQLDGICGEETIFASCTSAIPITILSEVVRHPELVVGMHFFSPVPAMKLVEIVPTGKTSEETIRAAEHISARMGKETVRVKDGPGFLVNRINAAFRAEAFQCLLEGIATVEDIDKAIRLGLNHPLGPFELSDRVGLEIGYHVFKMLYENYRDPKFRPPVLLEKLVKQGDLGRKTGKGWYDYTSGKKKPRTDFP